MPALSGPGLASAGSSSAAAAAGAGSAAACAASGAGGGGGGAAAAGGAAKTTGFDDLLGTFWLLGSSFAEARDDLLLFLLRHLREAVCD